MRLVRVGGSYDGVREQRLWVALLGLIGLAAAGVALVVCDAGSGLCHPTLLRLGIGLVAVVIAFRLGRRVTGLLRRVRNGRRDERLVADLLSGLPDDYWLVNDVTLGLARGTIDHVLIGPCGVVVIETKQLAGHIRCWGSSSSVNGYPRGDITQHVNSAACAIRYFLSEHHPDLATWALRWVESIVVFTHPLSHVEASEARATIVRYSQLYQVILELSRKHRLAPTTAGLFAETLAAAQARGGAVAERAVTSVS
ncbi:MAG: nuclease-related domain-containing protein [Candidatus Rokuibacteriota bacterium]